jgi:pimeloyl-ACP methyl ester carboxylesterase
MTPRLRTMPILTPGGFSRLAWAEWGPDEPVRTVLCVHGLTRNSRDFDVLAQALAAEGWRVVAPDVPGRGKSDKLRMQDYVYPVYVSAMAALIGRLGVDTVDWVGTSMGGLIGMTLAAQPRAPIRRMVINDIGPFIPKAALERIASYVQEERRFPDVAALEAYYRQVAAPFGKLTDAQWRHMAEHGGIPAEGGGVRLHYDPAIGKAFAGVQLDDISLWPLWEQIAIPMLVVRGVESDLLLKETANEMTKRGPAAAKGLVRVAEIAGCGHAPALMDEDQVALISRFLAG